MTRFPFLLYGLAVAPRHGIDRPGTNHAAGTTRWPPMRLCSTGGRSRSCPNSMKNRTEPSWM